MNSCKWKSFSCRHVFSMNKWSLLIETQDFNHSLTIVSMGIIVFVIRILSYETGVWHCTRLEFDTISTKVDKYELRASQWLFPGHMALAAVIAIAASLESRCEIHNLTSSTALIVPHFLWTKHSQVLRLHRFFIAWFKDFWKRNQRFIESHFLLIESQACVWQSTAGKMTTCIAATR